MSTVEAVARPAVTAAAYGISKRGAFCVSFLTRASAMGTISIISPYLLSRGVPVAALGFVMVGSAIGSGISATYAGRLVDRVGAWRVLVTGLLVAVVSVLGFIYAPDWPKMTACYFCSSAGTAAASNALRTAIGLATPQDEQEKTFGRLNSVATTGALIGPLLVGLVVVNGISVAPWFAVSALSVAFLASLFTRRREVTGPDATPAPKPDEATDGDPGQAADGQAAAAPADPGFGPVLRAMLPIIALVTTTATMYGIYATVWGVYLHRLGAANPVIAWSFAATMAPVVLLSPHTRRVLPNTPRWMVAGGATLCLGLLAFVYSVVTVVWLAIAVSVVEGLFMAVSIPVTYSLIGRQAPKGGLGRAFGVAAGADAASSGIGTAIAGSLIALGGVALSFRVAGAYCVAGTSAALLWWWRHRPGPGPVPEARE